MRRSNFILGILLALLVAILLYFYTRTLQENFQNVENPPKPHAIVIVEPRKHKVLQPIIELFDQRMDPKWDLYVFHGSTNAEYAKQSIQNVKHRNTYLHSIGTDNLTADKYNALFRKQTFWDQIQAEHILVFQTDVVLCKDTPHAIEQFMKFDYIGCPYEEKKVGKQSTKWEGAPFYGIGGLSYRKKSFMKRCIDAYGHENQAEDVLFSKCVDQLSEIKPTSDDLFRFCSQHSVNPNSFGAHKTQYDIKKEEKSKLYAFCPEARMLEGT